jgi:HEPN domain-containing protein
MMPGREEALRALRMADRDIAAFNKMKNDRDIHFSISCFHAQQAIEKCLKAILFEHEIAFAPVHDLARLAMVLLEHDIALPCTADELRKLNPFAVTFRYDDTDIPLISVAEVERMLDAVRCWAGEVVR